MNFILTNTFFFARDSHYFIMCNISSSLLDAIKSFSLYLHSKDSNRNHRFIDINDSNELVRVSDKAFFITTRRKQIIHRIYEWDFVVTQWRLKSASQRTLTLICDIFFVVFELLRQDKHSHLDVNKIYDDLKALHHILRENVREIIRLWRIYHLDRIDSHDDEIWLIVASFNYSFEFDKLFLITLDKSSSSSFLQRHLSLIDSSLYTIVQRILLRRYSIDSRAAQTFMINLENDSRVLKFRSDRFSQTISCFRKSFDENLLFETINLRFALSSISIETLQRTRNLFKSISFSMFHSNVSIFCSKSFYNHIQLLILALQFKISRRVVNNFNFEIRIDRISTSIVDYTEFNFSSSFSNSQKTRSIKSFDLLHVSSQKRRSRSQHDTRSSFIFNFSRLDVSQTNERFEHVVDSNSSSSNVNSQSAQLVRLTSSSARSFFNIHELHSSTCRSKIVRNASTNHHFEIRILRASSRSFDLMQSHFSTTSSFMNESHSFHSKRILIKIHQSSITSHETRLHSNTQDDKALNSLVQNFFIEQIFKIKRSFNQFFDESSLDVIDKDLMTFHLSSQKRISKFDHLCHA